MWTLLRHITAAVRQTVGEASPNDVHQRHSKGHGGQLVGFLLDLLLESRLVALQERLHAPLQDLLQNLHSFLHRTSHIGTPKQSIELQNCACKQLDQTPGLRY